MPGYPAISSCGPGRLDCFNVDPSRQIVHQFYDGGWGLGGILGAWESIGGVPQSTPATSQGGRAPAVASRGRGAFDVFVRMDDGYVYHKGFDQGGWAPAIAADWEKVAGVGGSIDPRCDPCAVSSGPGQLDLFAFRGTFLHKDYNGGGWDFGAGIDADWQLLAKWQFLDACLILVTGQLSAVFWGVGRLDDFTMDWDGNVYHEYLDADDWEPYTIDGEFENLGLAPVVIDNGPVMAPAIYPKYRGYPPAPSVVS